jgi:hypothetical protein
MSRFLRFLVIVNTPYGVRTESVVNSMPTSDNAGDSGPKPFRRPVSGRLLRFRYFQQQVPGRRYVTSFDTGNVALF